MKVLKGGMYMVGCGHGIMGIESTREILSLQDRSKKDQGFDMWFTWLLTGIDTLNQILRW
jgi:hypothetical protein